MTIDTTFNINQSVWFMKDNKPCEMVVYEIEVGLIVDYNRPPITYRLGKYSIGRDVTDKKILKEIFITKEELLKSL